MQTLKRVGWVPFVLAASPLAAQTPPAVLFGTSEEQPASVTTSEVGITDIVERQAIGTVQEQIRNLRLADAIFFNETIETGPDSATRVSFLDDSSLTLGPSSEVVIDRFIYDPDLGTGEMALSLAAGVFRFASGNIDDSNYTIGTPVGTIGIRGTVIEVAIRCFDDDVGNDLENDDCEVVMDVICGSASFDGSGDLDIAPPGSRLAFRPSTSSDVDITEIASSTIPLTGRAQMGESINDRVVELLNEVLPFGSTVSTVPVGQLADAAVDLAQQNPRLADAIVEAMAPVRPDAQDLVSVALLTEVPGTAQRVASALNCLVASVEPASLPPLREIDDEQDEVEPSPPTPVSPS